MQVHVDTFLRNHQPEENHGKVPANQAKETGGKQCEVECEWLYIPVEPGH